MIQKEIERWRDRIFDLDGILKASYGTEAQLTDIDATAANLFIKMMKGITDKAVDTEISYEVGYWRPRHIWLSKVGFSLRYLHSSRGEKITNPLQIKHIVLKDDILDAVKKHAKDEEFVKMFVSFQKFFKEIPIDNCMSIQPIRFLTHLDKYNQVLPEPEEVEIDKIFVGGGKVWFSEHTSYAFRLGPLACNDFTFIQPIYAEVKKAGRKYLSLLKKTKKRKEARYNRLKKELASRLVLLKL